MKTFSTPTSPSWTQTSVSTHPSFSFHIVGVHTVRTGRLRYLGLLGFIEALIWGPLGLFGANYGNVEQGKARELS